MPSYTQYMRQMAVLDAKDDDIESWITVKGNHIPIKKGQSKEDAVKSFIESKGGKEKGGDLESQGRETAKREASHEFKKRSGVGLTFTELGKGDHGSEMGAKKAEPKYDPEFETVRKNALANSSLYGGRYTQKSKAEAYKEYKSGKKAIKHHDDLDDMLESVMAYGGHKMSPEEILSSGYHGKYLQDYVNKYGEEEVKEAIKDMQSRIDHIKYDVYTDSEGGSYNSIVWKKDTEKKTEPKGSGKSDHKFTYQMLDRLRTDNEYWLGNGNRADKHLWAGNPKDQIAEMRKLYNSLPADKKPEWLTEKDIDEYEKKMLGKKKPESKKQPKDIMDWKFEDVIKLPSSDPRVHKYIAKNTGMKQAIVAQVAEALPNTEDLYFKFYNMSDVEKDALLGKHLLEKYPETFGTDY